MTQRKNIFTLPISPMEAHVILRALACYGDECRKDPAHGQPAPRRGSGFGPTLDAQAATWLADRILRLLPEEVV